MSKALIKLCVSKLNGLLLLLALTGVVCTHKIQAEEECLSSIVLCYECDSRSDPNCADPFDFSQDASLPATATTNSSETPKWEQKQLTTHLNANEQTPTQPNDTRSSTIPALAARQPKRLPATATCHGCCVKITSKLPDGSIYVKRTCTTNLQINYFMVGLVCMKESGDRGKMCFCETDYCNGQGSLHLDANKPNFLVIPMIVAIVIKLFLSEPRGPTITT